MMLIGTKQTSVSIQSFKLGARLVSLILVALVRVGVVAGQHSDPGEILRLSSDLVVLDAEVVSKKDRLALSGLGKGDLLLYEDGAKQHISYFSQYSLPLSIVVLLDVSGSVAPSFPSLQSAALSSLSKLKETDEAALMVFGGTARLVQGFTTDKQLVARAIFAADATGLDRGTDINEGVYQAALHLEKASPQSNRRVIIAVTDDTTSLNIITPRSSTTTFRQLHRTKAAVCGLLFHNPYRRLIIGSPGSIRTYAQDTGGIVVSAESKKLNSNLAQIVEHLRTRYTLGYVSSNPKRDGTFRKIKLELTPDAIKRLGEAHLLTRKGYYAIQANSPDRR